MRRLIVGVGICLGMLIGGAGMLAANANSLVPPPARDEAAAIRNQRIVPPPGAVVSIAQQMANRRIVLQFHYEFFDLGHHQEAAKKYLAEDYRVNDPQEPSGRDNYVNFFEKTMADNDFLKSVNSDPTKRPKIKAVLATDDLVMLVFDRSIPWPKGPNGQYNFISCDMFRLKDGKIVESWFSGNPAAPETP